MLAIILFLNLVAINAYSIEPKSKIVPKEVSISCDRQGYPKIDALKALVTTYCLNNQFRNDKISIKEIPGGFYSEKMYVVSVKKNDKDKLLFFFKISKKAQSTGNLIKIQEGPIRQKLKECINSNENSSIISKENLPIIVWLENVFVYRNNVGVKKTIEVTPAAQATLLQDILDRENIFLIKNAAYAIGKSLAAFHLLFMDYNNSQDPHEWKTMCHGDFSAKNTLFNQATHKVYFIDNEGINNGSMSQDLRAILTSLVMFRYLKNNYPARWHLYLEYCLSFLKGYIQSYPADKRISLAFFIEEILNTSLDEGVLHKKIIKDAAITGKEFNEKDFKKVVYNYLHTVD